MWFDPLIYLWGLAMTAEPKSIFVTPAARYLIPALADASLVTSSKA
jgi:hypothetical protein